MGTFATILPRPSLGALYQVLPSKYSRLKCLCLSCLSSPEIPLDDSTLGGFFKRPDKTVPNKSKSLDSQESAKPFKKSETLKFQKCSKKICPASIRRVHCQYWAWNFHQEFCQRGRFQLKKKVENCQKFLPRFCLTFQPSKKPPEPTLSCWNATLNYRFFRAFKIKRKNY